MPVPSREDEYYKDRVWEILCLLEEIYDSKGLTDHNDDNTQWSQEMEDRWFGEDSPDCLIGKCKSWKEMRTKLMENYGYKKECDSSSEDE